MNKKISVGICLSLIILTIAASVCLTLVFSRQIYNKLIGNISQRSISYDTVEEIEKIVSSYFYGTVSGGNSLEAAVSSGYVTGLGDSNSKYLSAAEKAEYQSRMEGSEQGCGIETYFDISSNSLMVAYVYPSSPAENAGVTAGCVIKTIDGEEVTRGNYKALAAALTDASRQTVNVEYESGGNLLIGEMETTFTLPTCLGTVSGSNGYIYIKGFFDNTAEDFTTLVQSLKGSGAENFIIDVRNVSDGTIENAVKVIDAVVPSIDGNIAVAKDKNGNTYKNCLYTSSASSIALNAVILVNSGTQGPAELFACDMRDINKAKIVGTTTAGNGTMQEVFNLENGDALLLTVAKVIPYGGEEAAYDKSGIVPDYEAELKDMQQGEISIYNLSKDSQVAAALSLFTAA